MPRNRNFPPHLEIRQSGFFWRRRLPWPRRGRGGFLSGRPGMEICTPSIKSFLCFSLRTHVLRDAKILARRLTEMSDLVFAADAETTMAITLETQAWILESLVRFEIEAFERARAEHLTVRKLRALVHYIIRSERWGDAGGDKGAITLWEFLESDAAKGVCDRLSEV